MTSSDCKLSPPAHITFSLSKHISTVTFDYDLTPEISLSSSFFHDAEIYPRIQGFHHLVVTPCINIIIKKFHPSLSVPSASILYFLNSKFEILLKFILIIQEQLLKF